MDNTVAQSIGPDAPAGTYTVQWRVTSADGHPISGTFGFTAEPGGRRQCQQLAERPEQCVLAARPGPAPARRAPPGWLWPVVAVMLLASALVSALIARRRRRR